MTTQPKPDKWERRRQRQAFLNRCASLKKIAPQLTVLTSRKIWDRAGAQAQSEIEQHSRESQSAIENHAAQLPVAEHTRESDAAVATN
jgi:hypothetical protein